MAKRSPYKISLGQAFLDRSSLIFLLFIVITFLLGGSAVYAEYKTGQLREKVVKPVQKFISEVAKGFESIDPPKNLTNPNVLISTSSATIKIETNVNTGSKKTNTTTTITYPTPTPYRYNSNTTTKSYEQSVAEMNAKADAAYQEALKQQAAWAEQQKAKGQLWLQTQSAQNAAEAKAEYDAAVKKMQEETEAWKKAHGF